MFPSTFLFKQLPIFKSIPAKVLINAQHQQQIPAKLLVPNYKAKSNTGLHQLRILSLPLSSAMGRRKATILDVHNFIWSYIKRHNLEDKYDGRLIYCDERLKKIYDTKIVTCFISSNLDMYKRLSKHMYAPNEIVGLGKKSLPPPPKIN
ncbi:unnamed protein product [Candida verbasci]|uniref:DM2 domain-containing protein n=1 Tax=Candida verbasci TaxID=1227364 RepID=A0A9W4X8E0_9ASCO|nr:unnamed protein product [Candida verbasci]